MKRTIILTGASDGIGAAAAKQLATDDNTLILVGRNPEKARGPPQRNGWPRTITP